MLFHEPHLHDLQTRSAKILELLPVNLSIRTMDIGLGYQYLWIAIKIYQHVEKYLSIRCHVNTVFLCISAFGIFFCISTDPVGSAGPGHASGLSKRHPAAAPIGRESWDSRRGHRCTEKMCSSCFSCRCLMDLNGLISCFFSFFNGFFMIIFSFSYLCPTSTLEWSRGRSRSTPMARVRPKFSGSLWVCLKVHGLTNIELQPPSHL